MGHESRGIGMHVRSILEYLEPSHDIDLVFYAFDSYDPIKKLEIKVNVPYTLIQTPDVKRSIDRPQDFVHLSKIIWHRFDPLRTANIDVFVQFDLMLGLPKFDGIKKVLVAYDLIPILFSEEYLPTPWYAFRHTPGRIAPFKKALRALYYRGRYKLHYRNFKLADQLISISENTSRSVVEILGVDPKKVTTIPLAPVFNSSTPKKPTGIPDSVKPFLFYIGATDQRKRVQDLVHAYDSLRERGYNIGLVLAGKEFEVVEKIPNLEIRTSIMESKFIEDIITLGYVDDSEKLWLYNHAQIFVFPTLYEGFGLPILEAMQHGCAVISYDNSSIPEVAGNAARLVTSGDVGKLTRTIEEALDNPEEISVMQNRGIEQAKKYTWPNYVNRFLKAIL